MIYSESIKNLQNDLASRLPNLQAVIGTDDVVFMIEQIANTADITLGDTGELCELIRQIITKERKPEDLREGLLEKIDEDNKEKVDDVVSAINNQIFKKLLPALGIPFTPPEATSKLAGFSGQTISPDDMTPTQTVPIRKVVAPAMTPQFEHVSREALRAVPIQQKPVAQPTLATALTPEKAPSALEMAVNDVLATKGLAPKKIVPHVPPPEVKISGGALETITKMVASRRLPEAEVKERFDRLPSALKTALETIDPASKVATIGIKHGLHIDKIGRLGFETGLVLLGLSHPSQFESRLLNTLEITADKIQLIAGEINNDIFLKIREQLKEISGDTEAPQPSIVPEHAPATAPVVQKNIATQTIPPAPSQPKEEELDREKILREIENPTPLTGAPVPSRPIPTAQVAPKPPAPPMMQTPTAPMSPKPIVSSIPRPVSAPVAPPPVNSQKNTALDMLNQKLSTPSIAPKSEANYSVDPYRETL